MAKRVSLRGKSKTVQFRVILVWIIIFYFEKYLSNQMHFITNGYKRFSKTNSTDRRQRVPLTSLPRSELLVAHNAGGYVRNTKHTKWKQKQLLHQKKITKQFGLNKSLANLERVSLPQMKMDSFLQKTIRAYWSKRRIEINGSFSEP